MHKDTSSIFFYQKFNTSFIYCHLTVPVGQKFSYKIVEFSEWFSSEIHSSLLSSVKVVSII